jgi:hypothetical protein
MHITRDGLLAHEPAHSTYLAWSDDAPQAEAETLQESAVQTALSTTDPGLGLTHEEITILRAYEALLKWSSDGQYLADREMCPRVDLWQAPASLKVTAGRTRVRIVKHLRCNTTMCGHHIVWGSCHTMEWIVESVSRQSHRRAKNQARLLPIRNGVLLH